MNMQADAAGLEGALKANGVPGPYRLFGPPSGDMKDSGLAPEWAAHLRSVAAEINATGNVTRKPVIAVGNIAHVPGDRASAIRWAQHWALSLYHYAMSPSPIAVRGLNPPHRPQGTPSRKARHGLSRHAVDISTRTARGKSFTVRGDSAPRRQTGRGA